MENFQVSSDNRIEGHFGLPKLRCSFKMADCDLETSDLPKIGSSKDVAETASLNQNQENDETHSRNIHEKKKGPQILLPSYPKHGVIGSSELSPVSLFYKPTIANTDKDFRRQKFDFHETYEKHLINQGTIKMATPLPGLGYMCRELKTEDFYKIDPDLPLRFRNPGLLEGYGCEKHEHPLFRTTSSEYGKLAPTVHDVPHEYHGLKNKFTAQLSSTGMPKNRSLNIK